MLEDEVKDIEKNIAEELKNSAELAFSTSDDELFKRATVTANNQQGTKDLLALGYGVNLGCFCQHIYENFKANI